MSSKADKDSDMAALTHGMNLDDVSALSRTFRDAAARLDRLSVAIERSAGRTNAWTGPDAGRFRADWPRHRTVLRQIARALEDQAAGLVAEVDAQRQASGGGATAGTGPGSVGGTPTSFLAELAALTGNGDAIPKGQIGLIRNGDGTYIVILPGVEDLSILGPTFTNEYRDFQRDLIGATPELLRRFPGFVPVVTILTAPVAAGAGLGAVRYEALERRDSYRDLSSTTPSAFGPADGNDAYAARVHRAMREAGVPDGARVMIVGHSGGGYAGASAALSPSFNSNVGAGGSYDVTHVLSLGADTSHYAGGMPAGTAFVPVNSRTDLVYGGEVLGTGASHLSWQHQDLFNGNPKNGYGHDPSEYSGFLAGGNHSAELRSFATEAWSVYEPGSSPTVERLSVGIE